eukprot:CAMPEP_0172179456 /NCGR_PEP_ID=MMETSP1050-20130122/16630_1 /TAXON_ID=233186 /ORGANISM="Cryptomonas curvata, Strain CCAP979/52" /LENGTH=212 /DNA_ID=CAMNT_0012852345 /DNA_START=80 /DNA_END=714 /DNA_ORIENTATION=-
MDDARLSFDPSLAILDTAMRLEGAIYVHRHIFCNCWNLDHPELDDDGRNSPYPAARVPYLRRFTWNQAGTQIPLAPHQVQRAQPCNQAVESHRRSERSANRESTPATSTGIDNGSAQTHLQISSAPDIMSLQLGGRCSDVCSSGASASAEAEEDQICAICRDPLPVAGEDLLRLPCSHRFHAACLRPWLARSNTCPTCRRKPATPAGDAAAA